MLHNINHFEYFRRKTTLFCKLSLLGMSTNQVGIDLENMTLMLRKEKKQKKKSIQKDDLLKFLKTRNTESEQSSIEQVSHKI